MNEIINGLMHAHAKSEKLPIIGALAVGRGNDFAYGADIPEKLEEGVAAIAAGVTRSMDVGFIKGVIIRMGDISAIVLVLASIPLLGSKPPK